MRSPDQRQRGVVLLLMLLGVFVAGASMYLGVMNNRQAQSQQQQIEVMHQMQLAKAALLAYAANAHSISANAAPGLLPCPDIANTGAASTTCNPTTEYIGRLPEYITLSSGEPNRFYFNNTYAGIDQQFWYAVAPSFIHSTDTSSSESTQGNPGTTSTLTLDGVSGIAAVIIAPGAAFASQDRSANPTNYAHYLDSVNGTGTAFFSSRPPPTDFNDLVIPITRSELMEIPTVIAAEAVKLALDDFHDTAGNGNSYPVETCGFSFFGTCFFWIPAQTNFRNAMNNAAYGMPNWFKATSGTLSYEQNWTGVSAYSLLSADEAVVRFGSCNIDYVFHYTNGITRESVPPGEVPAC